MCLGKVDKEITNHAGFGYKVLFRKNQNWLQRLFRRHRKYLTPYALTKVKYKSWNIDSSTFRLFADDKHRSLYPSGFHIFLAEEGAMGLARTTKVRAPYYRSKHQWVCVVVRVEYGSVVAQGKEIVINADSYVQDVVIAKRFKIMREIELW